MVLISPLSPNTTNAPTVEPSEAPQVRSETPVSQVTPVSSIASAPVAAVSKESINENVQALVQDLKQLLSEQSLKLLLQLLPALDDAKNAVLTIHDQSSDQQLLSSPLERELQRIFKAIENSGLVIDEKSLADSSQTFAALKNFAALQLQDSLKEIKEALAATASKLPSLPEVRLLNEIVKEISFTLSKDGQTIELTKESINSLIIGLNRLFSAISNELEASNSSKIRPEITKALSELISNLEQALKENAPAKSITNTLDRAVVNFKEFFNGYEPKEILKTHELKEFVAAVEQFTTAQADLAKINTLLQAFNEPSLYMFVALFGGNLSRIKFSHDEACEDGSKKKRGSNSKFSLISLTVSMPGFGAILVELAYKAKTIMMKLTLENEPKAEFMKSKAPLLRERFTEAGYELTQFDITHGNIREISPSWKDEEHLREGIFA